MKHLSMQNRDTWLLEPYEEKLKSYLIPLVPKWLQTDHLTYLTILWSILVIILAKLPVNYSYVFGIIILFQWITDMLDGTIGRIRNTGLVKWGYVMDHFLDYIFITSVFYVLYIRLGELVIIQFAILSSLMLFSHLMVNATQKLPIAYKGFGISELKLIVIILFIVESFYPILDILLIPSIIISVFFLIAFFINYDRKLRRLDKKF